MAIVRIPTPLRPHAGGLDRVEAAGSTVGEILAQLGNAVPRPPRTVVRRRRAAALRQRLRERRRHPLPGRPGHARRARR